MITKTLRNTEPTGIARVENPCVGVCSTTTVGSTWCQGCNRHYMDVIKWNTYTEDDKILAMMRAVTHRNLKERGVVDDYADYKD